MTQNKSENVVVLGATPNSDRYAYKATIALNQKGHKVFPVGIKKGEINGHKILPNFPSKTTTIDTITLYLNPERQKEYYETILASGTKRIIFNPGTENMELASLAKQKGIITEMACTLVMLSVGTY
ncbi:MAG: CoA-binding protein [Flavobacteriales bacterium]|nr:CoA-binding protein [Flavobacteriales bacterium]